MNQMGMGSWLSAFNASGNSGLFKRIIATPVGSYIHMYVKEDIIRMSFVHTLYIFALFQSVILTYTLMIFVHTYTK